jgi:hypothetical protein
MFITQFSFLNYFNIFSIFRIQSTENMFCWKKPIFFFSNIYFDLFVDLPKYFFFLIFVKLPIDYLFNMIFRSLCTEKNNHFEGMFHQYFEGLVKHTLFKIFQFFTEYPVFLTCNCESFELLKIFK